MEKYDKWVTLLIGLVGGWVISTAPGWLHASSHEDWWGIATAVGTVGAVIAALWLASNEARRRRREEKDRALLCAGAIASKMGRYCYLMGAASTYVLCAGPSQLNERFFLFRNTIDSTKAEISNEDLILLLPLGRSTVYIAANGLALMEELKHELHQVFGLTDEGTSVDGETASYYAYKLKHVADLLRYAKKEYEKLAESHVKQPSLDELHGPRFDYSDALTQPTISLVKMMAARGIKGEAAAALAAWGEKGGSAESLATTNKLTETTHPNPASERPKT